MAQRPTVTQMSRKFESHAFTGAIVYRALYVEKNSVEGSIVLFS